MKVVVGDLLPTSAASEYLKERGVRLNATTLKHYRWLGKGPAYHRDRTSGAIFYDPVDLDAWSTTSAPDLQRVDPEAERCRADSPRSTLTSGG